MNTGAVVALTLEEAKLGDRTTVKETLAEAGAAVSELIEREAETSSVSPQLNVAGTCAQQDLSGPLWEGVHP